MNFKDKNELQDHLAMQSMQIITHSGVAKSSIFGAFYEIRKENPNLQIVSDLLKEASTNLMEAGKFHLNVLALDSSGEHDIKHNLLMLHAEDQMLTTQLLNELSEIIIDIYKRLGKK